MNKKHPALYAIFTLTILLACFRANAFSPERLVKDARAQIGVTLLYDPAYARIPYPGGDVPIVKGVCTDVVIRALRHQGIDLQRLVHEDISDNFQHYPNLQKWRLKKPDTNIDHRRVYNLQRYFEQRGYAVADETFLPGDIVTWELRPGVGHIGIVSDKKAPSGQPLVIHNIGIGTQEEEMLYRFPVSGHYRLKNTGTAHVAQTEPPPRNTSASRTSRTRQAQASRARYKKSAKTQRRRR
ncbi:MAG: DUF1287 domain-containing protein [Azoarcus sp.]|jgi:uncharacterized protein YijF (DUF1287 family)|nr:DUF1287 domain-containing protein [Azoarcus sp.]